MNDLRLWRLLGQESPAPQELTPALRELAALSLRDRLPFLGLLPRVLGHAAAAVRAAAASCLRQAGGSLAFRALVRALHDSEQAVRFAAAEALRQSAAGDPPRWIHALFHPDADVRRFAALHPQAPLPAWYGLYLLPDPACVADLLPRLQDQIPPGSMLPLVFDAVERGQLPPTTARALLAAMSWQECFRGLSRGHVRAADQIAQVHVAAAADDGAERLRAALPPDALDDALALFWPPTEDDASTETFFEKMKHGLIGLGHESRPRVTAALLVTAARRGCWQQRAAELCAVFQPETVSFAWIPRAQRYRALGGLYTLGTRCPRLEDKAVHRLLDAELCRRPSGKLDLWAVGALLHLLRKHPYERLQKWFGLEPILEAFLEDMEHSAPFLCLADDSAAGRQFLINEIGKRRRSRQALFNALLVHAVTADALDFLEALDGKAAVQVFVELVNLAGRPGMGFSESKQRVLAGLFAARIAAGPVGGFLGAWLRLPAPEEFPLGVRVLGELSRLLDGEALTAAALRLGVAALRKFLRCVAWCAGFAYGKELQLAHALAAHADKEVRDWAQARLASTSALVSRPRHPGAEVATVSADGLRVIGARKEDELHRELVVRGCLGGPIVGLAEALARRGPPMRAHLEICVALLACHDAPERVAEQFARFGSPDADFLRQVDEWAVNLWLPAKTLPLLGHAWLYRWEEHAFALHAQLVAQWPGGPHEALAFARTLAAPILARSVWEAFALLLGIWRWRDKDTFHAVCTEELGNLLLDTLDMELGDVAARILVRFHEAGADPALVQEWRRAVTLRLPDLGDEVRRILQFWVDATGLTAATTTVRRRPPSASRGELLARIRQSLELEHLEEWCCHEDVAVVEEAALRLLELSEAGMARLLALLQRTPPPPQASVLAGSASLWSEGGALTGLRAFIGDPTRPAELRFLAGLGLAHRGETHLLDAVLEAACADGGRSWFRPSHWQELLDLGIPEKKLSLRLAASPQPHAYTPAVKFLTARPRLSEEARRALLAFLEAGTGRMRDLRVQAAAWLHRHGEAGGFPLLLQNEYEAKVAQTPGLLEGAAPDLVEVAVTAALTAGNTALPERVLLDLLQPEGVDATARGDACARLLSDGVNDAVKTAMLAGLEPSTTRSHKLRRLAETFAWGVRQGRELTGRLFAIEMIAGEQLGYTRLNQNKVYVNPLPLLRAEENGRDVVEGLIVHEFGHHVYHRGPEEEKVWKRADDEGLGRLLNLVADEHLERNLRARDEGLGDRLKRLGAHAFQHAEREMTVESLLDSLQGRAFEVLTTTRLGAARRAGRVRVQSGRILLEMEKTGFSFARFFRALRLGLGNRHHDPKVEQGLALFRGKFRRSSMEELHAIGRRLREIFGWEAQLLLSMDQDGCMGVEPGDLLKESEGLTNGEIQQEVERILNPEKRPRAPTKEKTAGRLWINVGEDASFETIPTVVPIAYEPGKHAQYARQVAQPARHMRRYLAELGLTLRPQRFRVSGKSFDRTRVRALVTRADPRVLIARQQQVVTDLFLAIVIDCSGSMQAGENIEKAKLFGVLLAEAARGMAGIDVRLFGFTDQVIYDAGDAGRCAVHGLHANSGNNDAAGLWHAAQTALASRRKAKLLVMISDGLPTECSVAALRGLVKRLSVRLKMCCAQVAVRPLEEVCFPNYVLLEESDPVKSVRRFGAVVARLVRKALRGG